MVGSGDGDGDGETLGGRLGEGEEVGCEAVTDGEGVGVEGVQAAQASTATKTAVTLA